MYLPNYITNYITLPNYIKSSVQMEPSIITFLQKISYYYRKLLVIPSPFHLCKPNTTFC